MVTISAGTINLKSVPEGIVVEGKSVSFPDGERDDFYSQPPEKRRPGQGYDFSYYRLPDDSVICHDRQRDFIQMSPYTWEQLKEMEKQGVD